MAEWSNAPHSKCGLRESVTWVRIPPSPPAPDFRPSPERAEIRRLATSRPLRLTRRARAPRQSAKTFAVEPRRPTPTAWARWRRRLAMQQVVVGLNGLPSRRPLSKPMAWPCLAANGCLGARTPFRRHQPRAEVAQAICQLRARMASCIERPPPPTFCVDTRMARWRSGDAADCKSVHAGSIPARASISL